MYIISPAQTIVDSYHNYQGFRPRSGRSRGKRSQEDMRPAQNGASQEAGGGLKALTHPTVWPTVKSHVNTSLTLVKNMTDFMQELSQMYEHHAEELQLLVANYRKKNAEVRKDRTGSNCMLEVWESMLQGVEADSQGHSEISAVLSRQVSRQALEKTFFRKLQARKLLQQRENLDTIVNKAEEHLSKCRQEYKQAHQSASANPNSTSALGQYLDAHNTYVTQLHSTNAIVELYAKDTLPDILQELDDVYGDLCKTIAESLALGAETISNRMGGQSRRWCAVWSECKAMEPSADTASLVRTSNVPSQPHPSHRLRLFTPPQIDQQQEGSGMSPTTLPQLKNELIVDRVASLQVGQRYDSLCEEANQQQVQCQQLTDSLSTMLRLQQRSLESALFNKANEIQEEISKKKYELKTLQLNIAANRAQRELFSTKLDTTAEGTLPAQDRKMSSASTASMKSKWIKAFKSLKTPPPSGANPKETDKRDGKEMGLPPSDSSHQFQEYTYKKITPCDVCGQVLRGHTRQGLKCRLCKVNIHLDCQERVGKCQTKSRLLRRQKSNSEIETRATPSQVAVPVTSVPHSNSDIDPDGPIPVVSSHHQNRRRRLFGMKSFMSFGHKSTDRTSSLPHNDEDDSSHERSRPFGQPLLLGSSSPSRETTPVPTKKH